MKDEYDFATAQRGKFRAGPSVKLPHYLDESIVRDLRERAEAHGVTIDELVQELLKQSA